MKNAHGNFSVAFFPMFFLTSSVRDSFFQKLNFGQNKCFKIFLTPKFAALETMPSLKRSRPNAENSAKVGVGRVK